jgi:hypothetical protein
MIEELDNIEEALIEATTTARTYQARTALLLGIEAIYLVDVTTISPFIA